MISGFDHVHIYCGDIEKAVAFFRDIFGGKELSREKRPNATMIRMDLHGVPVAFMDVSPDKGQLDPGQGKRGLDHLGFKTGDLESALKEMEKRGVKILQGLKVQPSGLKMAFVEGPEGLRIELSERD